MKKYLLVVFGEFPSEQVVNGVAHGMATIVDSDFLKFQQTPGSLVFHFASEVAQEEIHDFCIGLFFGLSENFILTEYTDKVTVHMEEKVKAHLLDLEKQTENVEITTDYSKMLKEDMEEFSNEFVEFILDEFKQEVKKPTLNQILDKINEKGMSSLTQFEKEILDNYSKD